MPITQQVEFCIQPKHPDPWVLEQQSSSKSLLRLGEVAEEFAVQQKEAVRSSFFPYSYIYTMNFLCLKFAQLICQQIKCLMHPIASICGKCMFVFPKLSKLNFCSWNIYSQVIILVRKCHC